MNALTSSTRWGLLLAVAAFATGCPGDKDSADDSTPISDDSVFVDEDADGYGSAEDCDDSNAAINPGALEVCDGVDNDCSGAADDNASDAGTYYQDTDGDGYGIGDAVVSCTPEEGWATQAGDCNDSDAAYNPGASEDDCTDPNDYNCDGSVGYADADGDGYAACEECDDGNAAVFPGATEICNDVDDDCNGAVDDGAEATTWYRDADGDAYGNPDITQEACEQPSGYVSDATDCDDSLGSVNPAATEYCNDLDDNCDGSTDGADSADAATWYKDGDSDAFGDADYSTLACDQPSGYVADSTDCDDLAVGTYPGADEYCDSVDNDCDGAIDNDPVDGGWYATDSDGDSFGAEGTMAWTCSGVDNELDCDDSDAGEPKVASTSGSSSGAGSMASPYNSIQTAIDNASQCVVALAGTYYESVDFGGSNVSVTSLSGAEQTIIDASGTGAPTVSFTSGESAGAVLDGFTLTGGEGYLESTVESWACTSIKTCYNYIDTYCGGGLYIDSSAPTLQNLMVSDNALPAASSSSSGDNYYYTYSYGGGVCAVNSTLGLEGVDILGNSSDQGGGLYVDENSKLAIKSSWIGANTSADGGGVQVDGGSLSLTNVAMVWNEATDDGGGALIIDGAFTSTNVTWGGNDAADGAAMYMSGSSLITLMNSIVWSKTPYALFTSDGSGTLSASYNDAINGGAGAEYSGVTDPVGTSGNISSDPMFTNVTDDGDWTNDDWSLKTGSPAINTGNPAASYNDADGSANDMGAWGGPGSSW